MQLMFSRRLSHIRKSLMATAERSIPLVVLLDKSLKQPIEVTERTMDYRVKSPYNPAFVAEVKRLRGARWVSGRKEWVVPFAHKEKLHELLKKHYGWDPSEHPRAPAGTPQGGQFVKKTTVLKTAATQVAESAPKTSSTTKTSSKQVGGQSLPEGHRKISRGEGYGGREFTPGETINHRGEYVTVVSADKYYVSRDGMSMGVGADKGYIYSAVVRPATEEEKAPLLKREAARQEFADLKEALKTDFDKIFSTGKPATSEIQPKGDELDLVGDPRDEYGGGRWFVIEKKRIWAIKNNGRDGDYWDLNNVRTGGAGAIGRYVPYSKELAERIRQSTDRANALAQEIGALSKSIRRRAKGKPMKKALGRPSAYRPVLVQIDESGEFYLTPAGK